jgi:hypothetical protein
LPPGGSSCRAAPAGGHPEPPRGPDERHEIAPLLDGPDPQPDGPDPQPAGPRQNEASLVPPGARWARRIPEVIPSDHASRDAVVIASAHVSVIGRARRSFRGPGRQAGGCRRPLAAAGLVALLGAAAPGAAAASTWAVSLSATVAGQPLRAGFQARLEDPTGETTALAAGVPVTVSRTATLLSLAADFTWGVPGCGSAVRLSGSGAIQPGAAGATASGSFAGTLTQTCSTPGGPVVVESPIAGTLSARDIAGTPHATLEAVSGTVTFTSPSGPEAVDPGGVVTAGLTVATGPDGQATLAFQDEARIVLAPYTRLVLSPPAPGAGPDGNIAMIGGQISVHGGLPGSTRAIGTATARVRDIGTVFSIRFSRTGVQASTVVAVQSGIVEVADRQGQLFALAAGQEQAFDALVPRVLLILPADQSTVASGQTHAFAWTAFAGAGGYLMELALASADFATPNSPVVEPGTATLRVSPGAFTESDGVVTFPLFVPAGVVPAGTRVPFRVFVTDAAGQVLPGTISSNTSTVRVE